MSVLAVLIGFFCLIVLLSQFGHRLAARNSLSWWLIAIFLCLGAIDPMIYEPLTKALGIKLVSNFVLASMVLFLAIQLFDLSAETTKQSRKFRESISRMAAQEYLSKKNNGQLTEFKGRKILVVLPCFNEQEALPTSCAETSRLQSMFEQEMKIDICYVNDGSTDFSENVLRKNCPSSYVNHLVNIGVAGVLMTGFRIAEEKDYDYVVQLDSDGQHPVDCVPDLIRFADKHQLDMVIGSRFINSQLSTKGARSSTTNLRVTGIVFLRFILLIFGKRAFMFDPTSGFRVYSKKARSILLKHMPDEYPEPEAIAILSLSKAKIAEFYVEMFPRYLGVSTLSGIKSFRFMMKVTTALLGLRLRSLGTARG